MIPVNDPFVCKHCGEKNPKAAKSYRNHCRKCLFSMHVDDAVPGDRLSACGGLMEPIAVTAHARKGYEITHECQRCRKRMKNKAAPDDTMEILIGLTGNIGM